MKYPLLAVLLFFSIQNRLCSQTEPDSLLIMNLDSVIVSSTRYSMPIYEAPYSIDIVDSSIISKIATPLTIENVLELQSGIIVSNRYNQAQGDKIQIRGIGTRAQFGVRGIKILLDGIPLTFPDGQSQLNNLDVQNIESIEIIKGPSSVFYGNSLGGVIYIQSKLDRKGKLSINPEFSVGSYGLKRYSVLANGNVGKGNFHLNAYHTQSDGFRDHSESKFYGMNLIANFTLMSNVSLSIITNYYNAPYLLNPSSLNKIDSENEPTRVRNSTLRFGLGKKIDQFQSGVKIDVELSNNSKISANFYGISRSLDNSIPGRIIDLYRIFAGGRVELSNKFRVSDYDFNALIGLDYESQIDNRSEFTNEGISEPNKINPPKLFEQISYGQKLLEQDEKVNSIGIFTILKFSPIDRITVTGGLRHDSYIFSVDDNIYNNSNRISMNNLSSMLGIKYKVLDYVSVFGNYSNGFQTPTTNELSNNPSGSTGFNTELNPEIINSYELGSRLWWNRLKMHTTISFYKMNISNMLIQYQSENEETFYRNAGNAENHGFETSVKFYMTNTLAFHGIYNFMIFKFTDYIIEESVGDQTKIFQLSGNYLPGIPKHKFSLILDYNISENLSCQAIYNWTDKFYTNDFNGSTLADDNESYFINDAYSIINFNLNYRFKIQSMRLNLRFRIDNLLNDRYNDSIIPNAFGNNFFEPASGRFWTLGIKLELNN